MVVTESQRLRLERARALLDGRLGASARPGRVVASGLAALDAVLPGGGLPVGAVTELAGARDGGGAMTLAMLLSARAARRRKHVIVVDRHHTLYPPAMVQLGLDTTRLIVVRPARWAEAFWVFEEALRCPAVAAVVGSLGRLEVRASRRLQLAAERGGGMALIVKHHDTPDATPANGNDIARASRTPSLAALQLDVQAMPSNRATRRLAVTVRKARGAGGEGTKGRRDEGTKECLATPRILDTRRGRSPHKAAPAAGRESRGRGTRACGARSRERERSLSCSPYNGSPARAGAARASIIIELTHEAGVVSVSAVSADRARVSDPRREIA